MKGNDLPQRQSGGGNAVTNRQTPQDHLPLKVAPLNSIIVRCRNEADAVVPTPIR
jgi:hypothetical protein